MMKVYLFCLLTFVSISLFSQNKVDVINIGSNFSTAVDISNDGVSNSLYIVEKAGRIKRFDLETSDQTVILDISSKVNSSANERGLLGVSFHPDFENNGLFYVNYNTFNGATIIARYTLIGNFADISSEKILMTIAQPFNNHNGGSLKFGKDGYLYIGLGDGGSGGDPNNRSQNPKERLGKMLRIDVNTEAPYLIPNTNPFSQSLDTLQEIFYMGLRNPWKFSFDQLNGNLYIADVGQNNWEEVDYIEANENGYVPSGLNFGWRCYEGYEPYNLDGCANESSYTFPIHVFKNNETLDGCSITGGYVYRGTQIPYLFGKYIYGDFCTGNVWAIKQDDCGNWNNEKIYKHTNQDLATFGIDKNGELYSIGIGSGNLYQYVSKCDLSVEYEIIDASCLSSNDGKIILNVNSNSHQIVTSGPTNDLDHAVVGEYSIRIIDSIGCQYDLCAEVKVKSMDAVSVGENNVEICSGGIFELNFNQLLIFDSVIVFKDNEYFGNLAHFGTIEEEGVYTFTGYNGTCENPILGFLNFHYLPKIFIPDITISDTILIVGGEYSLYSLFKENELVESNTSGIFIILDIELGGYHVTVLDNNGCISNEVDIIFNHVSVIGEESILLAPNPASDILYLTAINRAREIEYQIVNCNGKKVMSSNQIIKNDGSSLINLQNLPSGQYFLQIFSEGKKSIHKLMVTR